jgi:hypothetical protein
MARIRFDLPAIEKKDKIQNAEALELRSTPKPIDTLTTTPMSAILVHPKLNVKLSFCQFPNVRGGVRKVFGEEFRRT